MTEKTEDDSAWKKTSWKGYRLAQHRAFHALSFEEKLKAAPPKIPSPKVDGATSETESRRPVIP